MSKKKDARDLAEILARALRDFAQHADVADQTAATHLAKQLEENDNVRLVIELDKGGVRLECPPLKHTVRRAKRKT